MRYHEYAYHHYEYNYHHYESVTLNTVCTKTANPIYVSATTLLSFMLYNSGPGHMLSTPPPRILGMHCPTTISNDSLYRRCDTRPLSEMVTDARWRMLGHVLCIPSDTPAQLATPFAFKGATEYKKRRGRHQTNFLATIRADLSRHQLKLQCKEDIHNLREQA